MKFIMISTITCIMLILMLVCCIKAPESIRGKDAPESVNPSTKYEFFNKLRMIRGLTADDPPKTFSAELTIGYEKGRENVNEELVKKADRIENFIFLYLGQKKADEFKTTDIPGLEEQLKNRINALLIEKIDLVLFKELQVF